MKRSLRALVQSTAHLPLLSTAYRSYYRVALRMVTLTLRRAPGVRSIFVNRSVADGAWVAGYSDIDLVVVIDEASPAEDLARQRRVWATLSRLRRAFPMIGTVHLVTPKELALWLTWGGPRRLEFDRWKRLDGTRVLE